MRASVLMWILLALSLAAAPDEGLPPWEFSDAHTRLITSPVLPRTHTLRVDVPVHLWGLTGSVRVVDGEGQWLSGYPVLVDGEVVAVEVRVVIPEAGTEEVDEDDDDNERRRPSPPPPATQSDPFSIQVYLFETPRKAPERYRRLPVSLFTGPAVGVARPGTGEGFLSMYSKIRQPRFRQEVPNLSNDGSLDRLTRYVGRRQRLVWHLSTLWHCRDARELQFGVLNEKTGSWYLFIDRQPVFSWTEAERDDRQRLVSAPRLVGAGWHRVDFFGVLGSEEEVPSLALRDSGAGTDFQRFGSDELWSANGVEEVVMEGKGDVLMQGVRAELAQAYLFTDVDRLLHRLSFRDLSRNVLGMPLRQQSLMVSGRPVELDPSGRGIAYRPGTQHHALVLSHDDTLGYTQSLELPMHLPWVSPARVDLTFNTLEVPHVEPLDGDPILHYYLDVSPVFKEQLLADAELVVRQLDAAGQALRERRSEIPASPFRRHVALPMDDARAVRATVGIEVGGVPVVEPITAHYLRPTDEAAFQMSAASLRYGDGVGILRRLPRPTHARPSGQEAQSLLVVDDFMTQVGHVRDVLLPSAWGEAPAGMRVNLLTLHAHGLESSFPPYAKFAALSRILSHDADTIVWAVGKSELHHGMTVRDYEAELHYLIQATLAAGKLPVLVTVPIVGTLTQEHLRIYALRVMELAAIYQVPVVDLYSASLLRKNINAFYRIDDRLDVLSATPDAKGRAWLFQHIMWTIAQYNHARSSE